MQLNKRVRGFGVAVAVAVTLLAAWGQLAGEPERSAERGASAEAAEVAEAASGARWAPVTPQHLPDVSPRCCSPRQMGWSPAAGCLPEKGIAAKGDVDAILWQHHRPRVRVQRGKTPWRSAVGPVGRHRRAAVTGAS